MPISMPDADALVRTFPAREIADALAFTGRDAVMAAERLDQLYATLAAMVSSSGGVEPYVWASVVTALQGAIASRR